LESEKYADNYWISAHPVKWTDIFIIIFAMCAC